MKKYVLFIFTFIFLQSCVSYRTSTNLYALRNGMSKDEVTEVYGVNEKKFLTTIKGASPYITSVKYGCDYAELWSFIIYDCTSYPSLPFCIEDHIEYLIFKNNLLIDKGVIGHEGHGPQYGPACQ